MHHCIRTHSRPTDELEAAGLSSLENALFHPRMRSWWRAKAFVLIKTLLIRPVKHDYMASPGLRYSKLFDNCSDHPNASIEDPLPLSWPGHGTYGASERKRHGGTPDEEWTALYYRFLRSWPVYSHLELHSVAVGTISCSRQAAEPSASSFPRNERNRATGTATDVDPESPPRDQTTTVQRAESAPGSGPAEDSRGIGHSGLSTGGGVNYALSLSLADLELVTCGIPHWFGFVSFLCKPRLGRILNDSRDDPQPVTPATFNSSLDLITDFFRRYSPIRSEKLSAHHTPPGSSH
ncbi:uncharacterized protein CLUP02_10486 [Colletotrichum lupini]|uniref:Uncharacterized protein n=1 Tax=Colletotrichum lupini TaxID=145971 RepID=A0A9Q8SX01_9PEZI|nr:uncharacterized protein CLUP02_10486 [Colletotrichum lupini]UQC84990.1 hypothetical protein CLUP02_10486 [Colletotrichum lupini]